MTDPRSLKQLLADCRARFAEAGSAAHAPTPTPEDRKAEAREAPRVNPTIPKAFRWATLDAPELRARVARERSIAEAQAAMASGSLILVGPSGCGKTSLACALLRAWEARNPRRRGMFGAAWRLSVARPETPEVGRAMTVSLLVLDDLGSEQNLVTSSVRNVIFARAEAELPTWITTWMTAEQIAQRYGDNIARRLLETRYARAIGCGR
jgi:DNA replication protein DnaC